jgi:hypothetical protein
VKIEKRTETEDVPDYLIDERVDEDEEQQALINDTHIHRDLSAFKPNGYPFQTLQTFWS